MGALDPQVMVDIPGDERLRPIAGEAADRINAALGDLATYLVFKPLLDDPACRPIIGKELGDKATKVVYAEGGTQRTWTEKTERAQRRRFVLSDDESV